MDGASRKVDVLSVLDLVYREPGRLVEVAREEMAKLKLGAKMRDAVEQELSKRICRSGTEAQFLRPDNARIRRSNPPTDSGLPDLHKRSKWLTGTLHLLIKKYQDCQDFSQSSKLENIDAIVSQNISSLRRDFKNILQQVEMLAGHLKAHSWLEDTVADALQKDFDLDGLKDPTRVTKQESTRVTSKVNRCLL